MSARAETAGGACPPRPIAWRVLWAIGGSYALALYATSFHPDYGYFLDELYYLACARRLDWGYPDHPALYPALLRLNVALFGESLASIRLFPALCGALAVVLTGSLAARFGGGTRAQVIAGLSMASTVLGVAIFTFGSMNCMEMLFWTAVLGLFAERSLRDEPRIWLVIGALIGLGANSKHTILLLVVGLAFAVIASPLRRDLAGRWLWLGVAIAGLLIAPNVGWQWTHDWVSLEFYRNADLGNTPTNALEVLLDQLLIANPGTALVWGTAVYVLLFGAQGEGNRRGLRPLGWVFVALLVLALLGGKSRPDRIAGVYPVLFAIGAVELEAHWSRRLVRRGAYMSLGLGIALLGVTALGGAPVLSPTSVQAFIGDFDTGVQEEVGRSRLPLPLAHRTGWPEFIEEVDRVLAALPAELRSDYVFLVDDFGHAGALELFGGSRGYAPVYSPHNGWFFWGPGPDVRPRAILAIGIDEAWLRRHFSRVEEVGRAHCDYCNLWLDDLPLHLVTGGRQTLAELWPELAQFGGPGRKRRLLEQQEARRAADRL